METRASGEDRDKELQMEMREISDDYSYEKWIAILLLMLFLLPVLAHASPQEELETITLGAVQQGTLLLETVQPGVYLRAVTIETDIEIRIRGPIARAAVTQRFKNPSESCAEALYVFPLPENAAVDTLHMKIGTRRVEGQIKEREEARIVYEQARSEGRKASLLEQQRPNMFTIAVSSLLPEEEVEVAIEYQQIIPFDAGEYRLRFPMVVAPRYLPAPKAPGGESAFFPQYELPPMIHGAAAAPVKLRIMLEPGFPVARVESRFHQVVWQQLSAERHEVTLAAESVPGDRDFELVWAPRLGGAPVAAAFEERIGSDRYALVMLTPPALSPGERLPRETIFILDTSGSMEGISMTQAREALDLALGRLRPEDHFNVIEFDNDTNVLFPAARSAETGAIEQAQQWVRSLQADGGTEMMGALQAALGAASVPGMIRQVVFITDGQVGNEAELFSFIRAHLGESRLFTVGIGSAPNSHFMNGAARAGRGTFTYIGDTSVVAARMNELFTKLESPMLTGISVQFDEPAAEVVPARIPDLYAGEPLQIVVRFPERSTSVGGRVESLSGGAVVRGHAAHREWKEQLSFSKANGESGIGKLWARRAIEALSDQLSEGADPSAIRAETTRIALSHHLVSASTSLVAVDTTPTDPAASRCTAQLLQLPEPLGSGHGDPLGQLPQTATSAGLLLLCGGVCLTLAAIMARKGL